MNNKWTRESSWTIFAIKSLFCPPARRYELQISRKTRKYEWGDGEKTRKKVVSISALSHDGGNSMQDKQQNTNRCSEFIDLFHIHFEYFFRSREQVQLKQKIFVECGFGVKFSRVANLLS
jgi:hypothetical protein